MPLEARNVTVRLGGRVVLKAGCSFVAGLTVIAGPNGAGKTTLLKALAGLVPLASGMILWNDAPLLDMKPSQRAATLAYLPQNGPAAWPLPIAEIVALGRLPHGDQRSASGRRAVARALNEVGLDGFETRSITAVSGGERARALLARALAVEAPVLLVDEPVAALDPRHRWEVMQALQARAREGAIVVAVMHDLDLAAAFADRVVLMRQGLVHSEGEPRGVLSEPNLEAVFALPYRVRDLEGRLVILGGGDHPG